MYLLNGLDFYCRWHDRETSNGCGHTRVKNHRLQWCFSVFLLFSVRPTFFQLWYFSTSCLGNVASKNYLMMIPILSMIMYDLSTIWKISLKPGFTLAT